MKTFGFLSFGHYNAQDPNGTYNMLHQAVELATIAEEIGVNGAYFRVHHFAAQQAAPIPLLSAIAARTKRIEVGTGVIDMRYENPLHLAEDSATLDLLSNHRIALGVSRGSPEPADRGWEAFGYHGSTDPRGADLARNKFERFLQAINGHPVATTADHNRTPLAILPHSPGLQRRIWWGAGTKASAEQAARDGVNLMSSTLLTETGSTKNFGHLQAEQIEGYRQAWQAAGHDWTPRVSVSRSIFPITNAKEHQLFAHAQTRDMVGTIDGFRSTFGRTYAAEPDVLIEQLKADPAIQAADTLMLTIPNQAGVEFNAQILENFATHVAPSLGWKR